MGEEEEEEEKEAYRDRVEAAVHHENEQNRDK
jgi:hypothetical protein